jgi:hypothetical protein
MYALKVQVNGEEISKEEAVRRVLVNNLEIPQPGSFLSSFENSCFEV